MIVIRAVASYLPDGFEDNAAKMEKFAIDRAFLDGKIGVERVTRKAPGEETSDMCVRAFEALRNKTGIDVNKVDLITVCTQNPDANGMPQTSAIVHAKLGAPTACASFDISLGCSGYVYSLSVAKALMEANWLKTGLLFTCDPYSKILDPTDRDTALLFGDAAAVTLLAEPEPGSQAWTATSFRFYTDGRHGDGVNNHGGIFHMDGRAVVMFSLRQVPGEVEGMLREHGLAKRDVDLFLFHQGSKYIVDKLRERLELSSDQVPIRLSGHGNTVSSSIPLLLEDCLERADTRRILCNGFGVGLSIATALLEKQSF